MLTLFKQRMSILKENMVLLIDTNVMLDWMLERQPFYDDSRRAMLLCIEKKATGYIAGHSFVNAFYIARKKKSVDEVKQMLIYLCKVFHVTDIDKASLLFALHNKDWRDLEDGLQMRAAFLHSMDYIITRDSKDFGTSIIQALTPTQFLELFEKGV